MQWIPLPSKPVDSPHLSLLRTRGLTALTNTPTANEPIASAVEPADITAAVVRDTRVSNQEISVTLAGNLKLGAIFTGDVGANEIGYWLDAIAYTDRYEEEPAVGGLVLATRFGYGLRVLFRIRKANAKVNINYGLIGAALDAQFATGSYQIDAIGLGPNALTTILGGIAESGPSLNADTFYKLNNAILKNLVAYIKANTGILKPQPVAALVRSNLNIDSLDTSRVVLFAMRKISRGKSLHDALTDFDEGQALLVRLTYRSIMGEAAETKEPDGSERRKADEWLSDN